VNRLKSEQLFVRAQNLFPGGVNSPVRAFRAVGGVPPFIERAEGPYLFDADGNRYIDYVLSYGPLILGHADPDVVEAICQASSRGTSFGAPTEREIELAATIQESMPSLEKMRFVNSGTEATMSAIRLARAFTGRTKIIKFEGCYHGHADGMLVHAGSGVATLGLPDSPGVTLANARETLSVPYNDLQSIDRVFEQFGSEIAAVIVEPVAGNMGLVLPADGFLQGLRKSCETAGTLLIFDEVMTGFRVAPGGAQSLFGVNPDLTTLGKVIGGGLPIGAYGGRADIMATVAPEGPMYQAGTLSGNPLAMAAGKATLDKLQRPEAWAQLEIAVRRLVLGINKAAKDFGITLATLQIGSMFGIHLLSQAPQNWQQVKLADVKIFARLFHCLLNQGIYMAPSAFEAAFVSTAHTNDVIETTVAAFGQALRELAATASYATSP
jgi:glutamate-1-semialdehyde 2,1-aminomutase